MPISLKCSECGVNLKVPDKLAGKTGKCPKCAAVIVVPASQDEVADDPVATPSTGRKAQQGIATARPKTAAHGLATAPAKARKTVTVTDDDRADPDSDERPRHRKSKRAPAKSGMRMVLILGAVACLLLFGGLALAGGIGGYLWWRSSHPKAAEQTASAPAPSKPTPLAEESKYFPSNTDAVASIRVQQLRGSQLYKDLTAEVGKVFMDKIEQETQGGLPFDNIDRVVIAGPMEGADTVAVVRTLKAANPSELIAAAKKHDPQADYTESKVNGKTLYDPKPNPQFGAIVTQSSFCVINDNLLLFGKSATLRTILQRDKAPALPDKLKDAMGTVDWDKTVAGVMTGMDTKKANAPPPANIPPGPPGRGGPGAPPLPPGGPPAPGFQPPQDDIPPPEVFCGTIQVDKDIVGSGTMTFKDAQTAQSAKAKIEKSIQDAKRQPTFKDAPSDLFDIAVSANGNNVTLDFKMNGASVTKAVRTTIAPLFNNNPQPQPGFPPPQPGVPPQPGGFQPRPGAGGQPQPGGGVQVQPKPVPGMPR